MAAVHLDRLNLTLINEVNYSGEVLAVGYEGYHSRVVKLFDDAPAQTEEEDKDFETVPPAQLPPSPPVEHPAVEAPLSPVRPSPSAAPVIANQLPTPDLKRRPEDETTTLPPPKRTRAPPKRATRDPKAQADGSKPRRSSRRIASKQS